MSDSEPIRLGFIGTGGICEQPARAREIGASPARRPIGGSRPLHAEDTGDSRFRPRVTNDQSLGGI